MTIRYATEYNVAARAAPSWRADARHARLLVRSEMFRAQSIRSFFLHEDAPRSPLPPATGMMLAS